MYHTVCCCCDMTDLTHRPCCCARCFHTPYLLVRLVRFRVTTAIHAFYLTFVILWLGAGGGWSHAPAFYAIGIPVVALSVMVATQQAQRDSITRQPVRMAMYWLFASLLLSYVLSIVHIALDVVPTVWQCSMGSGTAASPCNGNYMFNTYLFLSYNPVLLVLLLQTIAFTACPHPSNSQY